MINLVINIACHKRREVSGQLFGFGIYISYSGWSSNSSVCPVHENIFNSIIKPALLKQHRANAHPSMISKNWSFFELKLSNLKRQKLDRTGMFWKTNYAAVHASFAAALHVAKAKKAHTIGETLSNLSYWKVLMLGEKASPTMKQISLSKDTKNPESMKCMKILRAR